MLYVHIHTCTCTCSYMYMYMMYMYMYMYMKTSLPPCVKITDGARDYYVNIKTKSASLYSVVVVVVVAAE